MKRTIRLISIFLIVSLLSAWCIGCNKNEDEEEIFNVTDFAFQYRLKDDQEYKRGVGIYIYAAWKNISQYPVTYIGSEGGHVSATLFCNVEGVAEYSFSKTESGFSSGDQGKYVIPTGEIVWTNCYFTIPMSAPSGTYHLRVSYKGGSETFYNVFTLSEEG